METENTTTDSITVLDDSRRNHLPTGRVVVAFTGDPTDDELAQAAGFGPRHWGRTVHRNTNDSTATVSLWND